MPNSRAVSRWLRPSTNVEPSDKAPRFSCSRPTSANRDIGLPLATFYAARSGTAPPLLWPTFSPAHTAVVERAGWRIFEVYEDAGISGSKGRDQRPAFDQMLKAVAQRRFDVVGGPARPIWPCCCGICTPPAAISTCTDTTTPAGRAMFQMMGVFAELERALIQERV